MKKSHNFRELKIWQKSMRFTKQVYLLTAGLPKDEKFGLSEDLFQTPTNHLVTEFEHYPKENRSIYKNIKR